MGWFKTKEEKAEKAALERIKDIRKKMRDITNLGEGAITIEGPKLKKYGDEIDKIKSDNLNSKAIQEAKLKNKFLLRKTNKKQNKTSGNNSVLAGIQKKYVANNKNKKNNNNSNKVIVKKTTNSSSPTQMDRNKTKSLKSKTFASKQKAFNKKYRA
jgi:hypothetical protein